jgi:hypothetical protein
MSNFKPVKITVRNKPNANGKISVGANTEVLLDGKPLVGVTSFSYTVEAAGLARATIEFLGDLDIEAVLSNNRIVIKKKKKK